MATKSANIVLVPEEPNSCLGYPIPAHIKINYIDKEGRRCTIYPVLNELDFERISNIPDVVPLTIN